MNSLKLSRRLPYSVRFVFVSTFSLQRGRAFVVGITNLSKKAVFLKAKAPADHVCQRRMWDEFKRGLIVAQTSQPAEREENLEYRNQLSGVCWGAVYCSIESIFLNHPVLLFYPNIVGYARTNVIGSRTSFVIASVRSSIHWNICI